MKVSSISRNRLRELLQLPTYSIIYAKGIPFFRANSPGKEEYIYKEGVTQQVIDLCITRWQSDDTGWYTTEERLLDHIKEKVERGMYDVRGSTKESKKSKIPTAIWVILGCLLFSAVAWGILGLLGWFLAWLLQ